MVSSLIYELDERGLPRAFLPPRFQFFTCTGCYTLDL
jgi:hypothetical protein